MSATSPGRSDPPVFAVAAFWAFVLGGAAFGVMFVANWRALASRTGERHGAPAGVVTVGAGPMSVSVPMSINSGPVSRQSRPPEISTSLVSAVSDRVLALNYGRPLAMGTPGGRRVLLWTTAAFVALIVGFSRIYLGVHWLTDVLGGYALGGLWLAALWAVILTFAGRSRSGRPPPDAISDG